MGHLRQLVIMLYEAPASLHCLSSLFHQSQDGDSAVLTVGRAARADGSRTLTASLSLDSINK